MTSTGDAIGDALLALLIISFCISFLLAFAMGANDVANAFGTSYGSRVLNFVQVCILATIFETLGSVLLGARVSDTISRGIANMDLYQANVCELMYGYLSALIGASGWLLIATIFKLPVSGTHSIVGAVIGFTIVAHGPDGVKWATLIKVVSSWFTSPLLSGFISSLLFLSVRYLVLRKENPIEAGSKLLPVFYGLTFAVISFMVINESIGHSESSLPIWAVVLISVGLGIICWLATWFLVMPWIRRLIAQRIKDEKPPAVKSCRKSNPVKNVLQKVKNSQVFKQITTTGNFAEAGQQSEERRLKKQAKKKTAAAKRKDQIFTIKNYNSHLHYASVESDSSDSETTTSTTFTMTPFPSAISLNFPPADVEAAPDPTSADDEGETPEIRHLFSFIQVVTATFASFSHGANDVSNSVGPLVGQWQINETQSMQYGRKPEWWLLLFGGLSMSVGLWLLGKRVMLTIGDDLASISPATGFCMELGAALTVLIASHIGVPISTTHCLVGSVVCVSLVRSRKGVDWKIVRNIGFSWIVTVPAAALMSAASMAALGAIFDKAGTFSGFEPRNFNSSVNATLP